jgi:hypothetical protein
MVAAAPLFDAAPAQLTSFFEGPDFMVLSNCKRLQLAHEGIMVPDDFIDFDAEGLKGIFLNLLKPPKFPLPVQPLSPRVAYAKSWPTKFRRSLRCT